MPQKSTQYDVNGQYTMKRKATFEDNPDETLSCPSHDIN